MRRILPLLLAAAIVLLPGRPADADAGDIEDARARAQAAAQELSDAETKLGLLDQEITDLEGRAAAAQETLDELRATVQETAVEQFVNAGSDQLQFAEEDINEQVRAGALSRAVTQGNVDAVDEYMAAAEDLDAATAELAERHAEEEAALEELSAKQDALEAELARLEEIERQRILEEQRRLEEERRRQEEAARLAAEQEAAEQAMLEAAQEEAEAESTTTSTAAPEDDDEDATTTTESTSTTEAETTTTEATTTTPAPLPPTTEAPPAADFVCPVAGPHTFIDSWGAPRSGGRTHEGVDMLAATGTPTVAPVSGNVTHDGNSLGGLSWHLYGDDGNYYYGTHLSAYENVGVGHVEQGTVIGYVGDSGNAAGTPHLHFEIHPNGGYAVNPFPTVSQYCSGG